MFTVQCSRKTFESCNQTGMIYCMPSQTEKNKIHHLTLVACGVLGVKNNPVPISWIPLSDFRWLEKSACTRTVCKWSFVRTTIESNMGDALSPVSELLLTFF